MNQGRIIVITGSPGTGKTTTASAVAKESDLEKSVHMQDVYKRQHLHHLKFTEKTKVDEAFECGEISPDTTE